MLLSKLKDYCCINIVVKFPMSLQLFFEIATPKPVPWFPSYMLPFENVFYYDPSR